jgi:cytochrome c-type biogenesis protein CcmH
VISALILSVALSGPELDRRTEEVASLLRCPVCQGLSVADSPAQMARNMKAEVREQLSAGASQEQILEQFEKSYGEFVRLDPPMRGVNWLVWLGPAVALLFGAALVRWTLRQGRAQEECAAPPADERLAAAVERVRALSRNQPGGAP